MATDIVCPHCKALLRLSVSNDQVNADLVEAPDLEKTDDDILKDIIGDDDDNKE